MLTLDEFRALGRALRKARTDGDREEILRIVVQLAIAPRSIRRIYLGEVTPRCPVPEDPIRPEFLEQLLARVATKNQGQEPTSGFVCAAVASDGEFVNPHLVRPDPAGMSLSAKTTRRRRRVVVATLGLLSILAIASSLGVVATREVPQAAEAGHRHVENQLSAPHETAAEHARSAKAYEELQHESVKPAAAISAAKNAGQQIERALEGVESEGHRAERSERMAAKPHEVLAFAMPAKPHEVLPSRTSPASPPATVRSSAKPRAIAKSCDECVPDHWSPDQSDELNGSGVGVEDAQNISATKAAADTLFDEGKKLIAAGDIDHACQAFEASLRGHDRLGVRLNIADCHERQGRTATAWTEFREVASKADQRRDARATYARQRADALEPRLVKLQVWVSPPNQLPGLMVRRNGAAVPSEAFEGPTPVDPGSYTVEASAPGYQAWSIEVDMTKSGAITVMVPRLAAMSAKDEPPRHERRPTKWPLVPIDYSMTERPR